MQRLLSMWLMGIAIVLIMLFATPTNNAPHKIDGTIIGVNDYFHATRIELVYKDPNGVIQERNIHQSEIVTDGTTVINPHDYLSTYEGKTPYGAIKGHEDEYQQYLNKRKGFHGWPETVDRLKL
jgi:hypothetical protein